MFRMNVPNISFRLEKVVEDEHIVYRESYPDIEKNRDYNSPAYKTMMRNLIGGNWL